MNFINLTRISLAISFISITCAQSTAQGIVCGFDEVSNIDPPGGLMDARFDGQIMTLTSANVFLRYDLSDINDPVLLDQITLPRFLYSKVLKGNLAMGLYDDRLYIYDVSDPASPVELSELYVARSIYQLEILDDYAYLFDNAAGIRVIDISDPTTPVEITALTAESDGRDMEIKDNTLWATSETLGLVAYDLNNPAAPLKMDLQPITLNNPIRSFTIEDDIIYALEYGGVLISIDISDPLAPRVLDRVEFYIFDTSIKIAIME